MKPSPYLDFWQPPQEAGDPVALFATTFVLEPDFFERDCLGRFLGVQTVEDSDAGTDVIARLELEELLREPMITVLADRSTRADRNSLRWNLLHAAVPGGLLHAKVAVLLWDHSTRIVLGSANLTSAGYRRQIELGLAIDLGPECLMPRSELHRLADELDSYLALVPGQSDAVPAIAQARDTLRLFRQRVATSAEAPSPQVRVALAPAAPGTVPLDRLDEVWRSTRPVRAIQLSPFWDNDSDEVWHRIHRLLSGYGARRHAVAAVPNATGALAIPSVMWERADDIRQLKPFDEEMESGLRLLHAKALVLEGRDWVATLVGSSNHTRPGLGLAAAGHRELNLWLGAPVSSKQGRWLRTLVPLGSRLAEQPQAEPALDEDEPPAAPALPLAFEIVRLRQRKEPGQSGWELVLQLAVAALRSLGVWEVRTPNGESLLDDVRWSAAGEPAEVVMPLHAEGLPAFLEVSWSEGSADWTVLADDKRALPPDRGIAELRAHHLIAALASGRSIISIMTELLTRRGTAGDRTWIDLDPLKRFDDRNTILRRGRWLSVALQGLQARLGRPVLTVEALEARLSGPLGPLFLGTKICEAVEIGDQTAAEGLFSLAEIALSVGRVNWAAAAVHLDGGSQAWKPAVTRAVEQLNEMATGLLRDSSQEREDPVAEYADRAFQEAQRCLL